jgi:hypothetical protein
MSLLGRLFSNSGSKRVAVHNLLEDPGRTCSVATCRSSFTQFVELLSHCSRLG